jgi:ketosteroid isomerase-like protein
MPEPSATPDLVELTRQSMQATNRRDYGAAVSVFAPDAVFDMSAAGLGHFEGVSAIRGYLEDWIGAYEEQEFREWEGVHLGNGVVLVVALLDGRPVGSEARVQERWAFTLVWEAGRIARVAATQDIAQARAAAERLARTTA